MIGMGHRIIPLLFLFSGAAGLMYEVVWLRMLVRAFGVTVYATSNVLMVYMAGMALGSWVAGRLMSRARSPLKVYGWIELALVLVGAGSSWAAAALPEIYAWISPGGMAASPGVAVVRTLLACAVLLPPTVLMGMTLPALAEYFSRCGHGQRDGRVWDRPAVLYGVNTLGAVGGVIFSGFYSLGTWGEIRTVGLAVGLNLVIGIGALLLATARSAEIVDGRGVAEELHSIAVRSPLASMVPWLMALSGFCALAVEVLWTRMLVLLVGTSVYAFSTMLASYLVGIGLGSLLCGRWLSAVREPERVFAWLQAAAGLLIVVTFEAYFGLGLARSDLGYILFHMRRWQEFLSLFGVGVMVVLPVTLVYGALFPLAVRLVPEGGSAAGIGRIYAMNTVGALVGAMAGGFLLIPNLGTQFAVYFLCAVHFGLAVLVALAGGVRFFHWAPLAGVGLLLMAAFVRPDPFFEILRARLDHVGKGRILYHREGVSATVTVYADAANELVLVNGILVSGKGKLGRFMADLPLLIRSDPKRALVLGLGAGNTFRASLDRGVKVDLVELEPELLESFAALWQDSAAYLENPRARVVVNDARNFLLTSEEKYDAVILDGSPPIYSAGTVNLYSREFVRLTAARLTPEGILALWVPLPCFESDFWMIARNLTDTFDHTLAWAIPGLPGVLVLGSRAPLEVRTDLLDRQLFPRSFLVADHLIREAAASYSPVTDDRPWTEFPLSRFWQGEPLLDRPEFLFQTSRRPL